MTTSDTLYERRSRQIAIIDILWAYSNEHGLRPYPVSFADLNTQFQSPDIMDLREHGLVVLDTDHNGHPGASLTERALSTTLSGVKTIIRIHLDNP